MEFTARTPYGLPESVPWIHSRMGRKELIQTARAHGVTHQEGTDLHDMMDYLFISDYFNRAPAERYVNACRDLPVSKMVRNYLWPDGEEELTPEIVAELKIKGYTKEELLAASHSLIAYK